MSITVESSEAVAPLDRADPALAGARVLLVHEWLYTWAGAERVLEQLVELMPHADVLAGIVTPAMRQRHAVAQRARESWVGRVPGSHRRHRWFLPLHAAAFAAFDTSRYDLVVSVSHAFEKAIRPRKPGAPHVSYCLTPPRYLWGADDAHARLATPAQRLALRVGRAPFRALDRAIAARVDRFVSLSACVAARVRRAYGRESAVVYPPVSVKPGPWDRAPREPFLFTMGRLVPYKRVDLAVRAAEMLGMRLVVAGDGPERARLQRLAGPHTELIGQISEATAGQFLSRCAAFVFCADEDFGIAPVEANAHGAPVVAYARGGALETMQAGRTAVFFEEQQPDAVAAAIRRCLDTSWDDAALRANARRFAPERFRSGIRRELHAALGVSVRE